MHTAHFFLTKPSAAGLVQVATPTSPMAQATARAALAAHGPAGEATNQLLAAEATGANS